MKSRVVEVDIIIGSHVDEDQMVFLSFLVKFFFIFMCKFSIFLVIFVDFI